MLEARGLCKSFGKIVAVRGVSFSARDGQITGLLGPNGAGKSTTLRMLYTVLRPDEGDALIDGRSVLQDPLAARRAIGVLSHGAGVYNHLTARENIAYFGELHGMSREDREARAAELIELLEMQPFADRLAKGFSQGQKLKTALARALVHRPKNVLLDEPTNGLDVMAVRGLRKLLAQLRDAGHCVLFSSHVMQEVEQLCDEVVVIANGQVVAAGSLADIRARGGDRLEDAFVALMEHEPNPGRSHEPARHLGGLSQGISREPARSAHAVVGAGVRAGARTRAGGRRGAVQHLARRRAVGRKHRRRRDARRARAQPAGLSHCARRRHRESGLRRGRRAARGRHADAQDHPRHPGGLRRSACRKVSPRP